MDLNEIRQDPIFVLGMGRSGSTFLQHALCQVDDVWIWGEHDEMLTKLLDWFDWVAQSEDMERFATAESREALIKKFPDIDELDATGFAWMNGFSKRDVKSMVREIILRLFALNLPTGKTRWGFKEIRYTQYNRVVDKLLELFPLAQAVYTVRAPRQTIESGLLTWNLDRIEAVSRGDADATMALGHAYWSQTEHWVSLTNYFIELGSKTGRVFVLPVECFDEKRELLGDFLGLAIPGGLARLTNKKTIARECLPPTVQSVFEHSWSNARPLVVELATSLGYQT